MLLDTERRITDAGLVQISSGLLPVGTVLLSSRAPIGYLAVAEVPVAINQGFIAMKPRTGVSNLFLLLWSDFAHDDILSRANGSTFLKISKANFRPIPSVAPPAQVMEAFDQQVRALYQRIVENEGESRTTRRPPRYVASQTHLRRAAREGCGAAHRESNLMANVIDTHHRRSIRLKDYDYSHAGAYFVTICTRERVCLFGQVVDGTMRVNEYGEDIVWWWDDIPRHCPAVEIDGFVVMPNHIHGLIVMTDEPVGAGLTRPESNAPPHAGHTTPGEVTSPLPLRRPSLGNVVAYFKYQSAKQINISRGIPGAVVRQRNYYEHIIRNEASLNRIRQYILDNPVQ